MPCPFRYRATSNVKLPLRVIATVNEIGTTQVSYTVSVKANFGNKLSATDVVLRIPTPLNTTTVDCKVANGKAKYVPAENVVIWKYVCLYHLHGSGAKMLHQSSTNARRTRVYIHGFCCTHFHDNSTGVGSAANRRRLPGPDVHCIWANCSLFEGIREKQLSQY